MNRKIKNVYDGLPPHLATKVLWVDDKYRINPLSLIQGGTDVIVEYHSKEVFGYDKIKFPSKYMDKIFHAYFEEQGVNYSFDDIKQGLLVIKTVIKRLFARQYRDENDYETASFQEVWNSETSTNLPSEALHNFTKITEPVKKIGPPILDLAPVRKITSEKRENYLAKLDREKKRLEIELVKYYQTIERNKQLKNNPSTIKRRPRIPMFPVSKYKDVVIKGKKVSINDNWNYTNDEWPQIILG